MLSHTGDSEPTASCELRELSYVTACDCTVVLESDRTEELRVPWCVSISDCYEHTAVVAPVRVTPYSFQTCWNDG